MSAKEQSKSEKNIKDLINAWINRAMDINLEKNVNSKLDMLEKIWALPEVASDPDILEEKFGPVFSKFLTGQPYATADVEKCAEFVLKQNMGIPLNRLQVIKSVETLHTFLGNNKTLDSLFVVFEEEPKLWVTFAIVKTALPQTDPKKEVEQEWTVLYKHPGQDDMGKPLRNIFAEKNAKTTILCGKHMQFKGCDNLETAYSYSGPLAIRNLKVFKSLVEKETTTGNDLVEAQFTDVKALKLLVVQKMRFHAQLLYKSKNFKSKFEKFRASLPTSFRVNAIKVLESKTNQDYRDLRLEFFSNEALEDVQKSMAHNVSKELKSFQTVAKILSCCRQKGDLYEACYKGVKVAFNKLLGLDPSTMQKVFKNEYEVAPFQPSLPQADDCRVLTKIPGRECSLESITSFAVKDSVKKKLKLCNFYYNSKSEPDSIRKWADETRSTLKFNSNVNDPKNLFVQGLAKIKRGFVLSTGNENCQDLLLLYLIMILEEENVKLVTLHDMRTRTYLIAALAIAKVLMGCNVDVVTNSEAQAAEAISLTEKFYNIFGISVAHNCSKEFVKHTRRCYFSDVVYGPMEAFQFDHLKEEVEGIPVRDMDSRPYFCLLIDEADNVGISENLAKLASHFPGMEYLRYIYINIWEELRQLEVKYATEVNKDALRKLTEITVRVKAKGFTDEVAQVEYEKFLEEALAKQVNSCESQILVSGAQNVEILPRHLLTLVEANFGRWVKSAIRARFNCVENRDYRVIADEIVPLDPRTGAAGKGVWTDGLHQFLQLKHGLRLSCEKLKSVFMSNVAYIRQYPTDEISCFASSFGSDKEMSLLNKVHYHLTFIDLPDAQGKTRLYQVVPGMVSEDATWHADVVKEAVASLLKKQAVVVVCGSFEDAQCLTESFEYLKSMNIACNVRKYFEDSHIAGFKDVDCGDVIIATSLVAVSVGLQLTDNLIANNGICLILGFLPPSEREEERIFSIVRNRGQAKSIIRRRDTTRFKSKTLSYSDAVARRNVEGKRRLEFLESKILPEIKFKDEIFEKFKAFYTGYRVLSDADVGKDLVLRDFKESWALWLERQDYTAASKAIANLSSEEEFAKFLKEMGLFDVVNMDGATLKNPYYVILRAQNEMKQRDFNEAEVRLGILLKKDVESIRYLSSVNLTLFQLLLEKRNYIYNRLTDLDDKFDIKKQTIKGNPDEMKVDMKTILDSAIKSLNGEVDYLKETVINDYSILNKIENVVLVCGSRNSPFLEQMTSRFAGLKAITAMMERLQKDWEDYKTSDKLIFRCKVPRYFQTDKDLNRVVLKEEVDELEDEGFDSIYWLDIVKGETPVEIKLNTKNLISIGRKLLDISIFYPLFSKVGVMVAVDGICASVASVFTDFEEFADARLMCSQVLSSIDADRAYGDEFLTRDVVDKAVEVCQQMHPPLDQTPLLAEIKQSLSKLSEDIAAAKTRLTKERQVIFHPTLEQVGFQVVTNNQAVLSQPGMKIFFDTFLPWLGDHLAKHFKTTVYYKKSIRMELQHLPDSEEAIVKTISDHVQASYLLVDLAVAMAKRFRDLFQNWLFFAGVAEIYNRDPSFIEKELVDFSLDLENFITYGKKPKRNRNVEAKKWDELYKNISGAITGAITTMTFKVVFSTFFFVEGPQVLHGFESQLKREGSPAKPSGDFQVDYALAALNLFFIGKIGKAGVEADRLQLLEGFKKFMMKY